MYIPGSNNGTWGYGMKAALYPSSMGGPFGQRGNPLPNTYQHPAPVMNKAYSFGKVYQLTPGGSTTEDSWGFERKSFGKRRRRSKSFGKRRRRSKSFGKKQRHSRKSFGKRKRSAQSKRSPSSRPKRGSPKRKRMKRNPSKRKRSLKKSPIKSPKHKKRKLN